MYHVARVWVYCSHCAPPAWLWVWLPDLPCHCQAPAPPLTTTHTAHSRSVASCHSFTWHLSLVVTALEGSVVTLVTLSLLLSFTATYSARLPQSIHLRMHTPALITAVRSHPDFFTRLCLPLHLSPVLSLEARRLHLAGIFQGTLPIQPSLSIVDARANCLHFPLHSRPRTSSPRVFAFVCAAGAFVNDVRPCRSRCRR